MSFLFAAFSVWLFVMGIADIGCFMFEVPFRILEAADYFHKHNHKILAAICYAIGWPLHVLVRVMWYGSFIAVGGLIVYVVGGAVVNVLFKG